MSNQTIKLEQIEVIKGKIEILTGLHIGASDIEMKIGGVDSAVLVHPVSKLPYIPGSSIKGKIRSLLELVSGKCTNNGGIVTMKEAKGDNFAESIVYLFGESASDKNDTPVIGRLSFCDARYLNHEEIKKKTGGYATEVKTENVINRLKGTAEHPRSVERVPAGAVFEFEVFLKVFQGDQHRNLFDTLTQGLKLLEMDSLGGNGSRGYGKVKFSELTRNGKEFNIDDVPPFNCKG